MCYRCRICTGVVPHGTPLLRHIIYRVTLSLFGGKPQKQIAQEIPVCGPCKEEIDGGVDPYVLQLAYSQMPPTEMVYGSGASNPSKKLPGKVRAFNTEPITLFGTEVPPVVRTPPKTTVKTVEVPIVTVKVKAPTETKRPAGKSPARKSKGRTKEDTLLD